MSSANHASFNILCLPASNDESDLHISSSEDFAIALMLCLFDAFWYENPRRSYQDRAVAYDAQKLQVHARLPARDRRCVGQHHRSYPDLSAYLLNKEE